MKRKRWLVFSALALIVLATAILGGLGIVCNSWAHRLVHPARISLHESPADYGLEYETIALTSKDGYRLAAWMIPSQNRAAVLVQHGYPGNRAGMLRVAEVLARHGYGVIMVDLRAQGLSEGDTVSFGMSEVHDVDGAYRYLLDRPDVDPERIGALGSSMGGVVVLLYAAQNPGIVAVVSDSAFASLQDEVATGVECITGLPAFPFAPVIQWLAEKKVGFDADQIAPLKHIASISPRPVLLLQGGADATIPPDSGQRLYDAAGQPRELWFEPHLGHCEFITRRPKEYEARVVAFFDRYLLRTTAETDRGGR